MADVKFLFDIMIKPIIQQIENKKEIERQNEQSVACEVSQLNINFSDMKPIAIFKFKDRCDKNKELPPNKAWCYSCKTSRLKHEFYNIRFRKWSYTCHLCRKRKNSYNQMKSDPLYKLLKMDKITDHKALDLTRQKKSIHYIDYEIPNDDLMMIPF